MNTQRTVGAFYLKYKDRMKPDFRYFMVRFHEGIRPNSSINDYRCRDWLFDLLYQYMENGNYTDEALAQLHSSLSQIETLTD